MFDAPESPVLLQRARGFARVLLEQRRGAVRLASLRQEGSAKAMLPAVHGAEPEVVFLNTAGGLTGGDRIAYALELGAGASAVATTQTAERAYASTAERATMNVDLKLATGARLDWLPQETILFEASALERRTEADLARDARLLLVETAVLGRRAMGENVERLTFRDSRIIRRDGRAVLIEPLLLDVMAIAHSAGSAVLGGARVFATVALVAPGAEEAVRAARQVPTDGVEAAASGWNGKCVVRVLGSDSWPVRQYLARLLVALRGTPLPRVWQI